MNVQSVQNQKYPNFRAIKVAEARSAVIRNMPKLDIFMLEDRDKHFLASLKKSVKYKNYYTKMSEFFVERWQKIFNYCVDTAMNNDNTTYLAFYNNKPCGIMTYQNESPIILDGICSIPIEKDRKLPFVGKSLLYQLFKDAKELDAKGIKLKAVTDGPFDVISKYERLGFKREYNDSIEYVDMHCNKHKVKEQLKEFPFEIDYYECDGENVNLIDYVS